jgi:hypothetical protein
LFLHQQPLSISSINRLSSLYIQDEKKIDLHSNSSSIALHSLPRLQQQPHFEQEGKDDTSGCDGDYGIVEHPGTEFDKFSLWHFSFSFFKELLQSDTRYNGASTSLKRTCLNVISFDLFIMSRSILSAE